MNDPVIEAVVADLRSRSAEGIKKYGCTLHAKPGTHRSRLQHAYEEALDLANYLKWELMALDEHFRPEIQDRAS